MRRNLVSASCLLLLAGCARDSGSRADSTVSAKTPEYSTTAVQLVDTSIAPAIAGRGGWDYQQSTSADLDADGQVERVVLTAQVALMRGRPLWDDGQRWQVYVEESDNTRTYIYARFVQLGTVSLRLTEPDSGQRPTIVLLEQLPDRLAIYEVEYLGPGRARTTEPYERALDPRGDVASPALP